MRRPCSMWWSCPAGRPTSHQAAEHRPGLGKSVYRRGFARLGLLVGRRDRIDRHVPVDAHAVPGEPVDVQEAADRVQAIGHRRDALPRP